MTRLLLDPTNERTVLQRSLLPRPASIVAARRSGCSTSPRHAAMCSWIGSSSD